MENKASASVTNYSGNTDCVVSYQDNYVVLFRKPWYIWIFFGMLGQKLWSYNKEYYHFHISEVRSVNLRKSLTGKPIFQFHLKNNQICTIKFNEEYSLCHKFEIVFKNILTVE